MFVRVYVFKTMKDLIPSAPENSMDFPDYVTDTVQWNFEDFHLYKDWEIHFYN